MHHNWFNVQFSRCILWVSSSRNSMKHHTNSRLFGVSVNLSTYSRFTLPFSFKKWWAKMDSNHRPHDYQSCALASWAIGPFKHFLVESTGIEPVTSCLQGRRSPSWANPPDKGFFSFLQGSHRNVPSKLNNVKYLSLCTDLRTLQARSSSYLKSP